MRSAPPVRWLCERQSAWRAAQVVLHALAAAATVAWLSAMAGLAAGTQAIAALLGAVLIAFVSLRVLRDTAAELNWSGQVWSLLPVGGRIEDGQLDLMIDLGRWMLLRFQPHRDGAVHGAPRWIAASAGTHGAAWSAFRAALYSSATQTSLASASAESQPD